MNSNIQTVQFMQFHPGQQQIVASPARFRVVACGRRFGKTALARALIATYALLGARTWWLAPTYAMASQVWRELKTDLRAAHGLRINESERRLMLSGAGFIEIHSAHQPDLLRGAGLDFVVLDEAAFMEPELWPQVVRPMLADRQGGAIFLSTPRGHNHFYRLYQRGLDPAQPEWQSFRFPTLANPGISTQEIEAIRRSTPERIFREEYLAEFISDSGRVFRGLDALEYLPPQPAPRPGQRYVAGVDWGRDADYTCIAIIEAETRRMVALERFTGVSWNLQRGRLMTLARHWSPDVIWAEANSIGSPNIEALQNEGLPVRPFMTSARSKAPLIEGLALAIERRELSLLDDPVLRHELALYDMTRLPGGGYRYGAPAGEHDDTVIATALAWHGLLGGAFQISFS